DVGRYAVEFLPHLERIHGSHALGAPEPDPEPLALADMSPGDVEKGRDAVLAHDEGAAGLLYAAILPRTIEGGAHPLGLGPAREPESQIENGQAEVYHGPATRLIPPLAPTELRPGWPVDVPAAPRALDRAELPALHEAANDLHVRPIPVVHPHHDHAVA